METVELRCETNPRRLFAKLRQEVRPKIVPEFNLIEFKCRDCAAELEAVSVFHRFNIVGELVETEIVGSSIRER